jgi:outer membrane receptor for Fe3+-dicitrate
MDENCENCGTEQQEHQTFGDEGHELRKEIKRIAERVRMYSLRASNEVFHGTSNIGEMIANAKLSYRHLEDAAMRIGKALQAYQGVVSILDKMTSEERETISDRPVADESCT